MSWKAIDAAMKFHRVQRPTNDARQARGRGVAMKPTEITAMQHAVLIGLCYFMNPDTGLAWASTQTLADFLRMSRSTVVSHLEALRAAGFIECVESSRNRAKVWQLPSEAVSGGLTVSPRWTDTQSTSGGPSVSPRAEAGGLNHGIGGLTLDAGGLTPGHEPFEPLSEPKVKTSGDTAAAVVARTTAAATRGDRLFPERPTGGSPERYDVQRAKEAYDRQVKDLSAEHFPGIHVGAVKEAADRAFRSTHRPTIRDVAVQLERIAPTTYASEPVRGAA